MVLKFEDFINEAKKDKDSTINLLVKILTDKPLIELNSKTFPDEKGAYTLSGLKKYFKSKGFTSGDVDDAFYTIDNNKEYKNKYKIEYFNVKNYCYDQSYPYHYMGLSKSQADKLKDELTEKSKEMAKPEIEKKVALKKKAASKVVGKSVTKKKATIRSIERKIPK